MIKFDRLLDICRNHYLSAYLKVNKILLRHHNQSSKVASRINISWIKQIGIFPSRFRILPSTQRYHFCNSRLIIYRRMSHGWTMAHWFTWFRWTWLHYFFRWKLGESVFPFFGFFDSPILFKILMVNLNPVN